jgi:hypothetical protein
MEIVKKKLKDIEEKADIIIDDPTPKQILKHLAIGDRVSYVGKDNKYRSGGFIMTINGSGTTFAISGGNLRWSVLTDNLKSLFIFKKNVEEE